MVEIKTTFKVPADKTEAFADCLADIRDLLNPATDGPTDHKLKRKAVHATKDDDGHWYVVPVELKDKFYEMLRKGPEDEYEEFSAIFDHYRTGGDLNCVQLYAEI